MLAKRKIHISLTHQLISHRAPVERSRLPGIEVCRVTARPRSLARDKPSLQETSPENVRRRTVTVMINNPTVTMAQQLGVMSDILKHMLCMIWMEQSLSFTVVIK